MADSYGNHLVDTTMEMAHVNQYVTSTIHTEP